MLRYLIAILTLSCATWPAKAEVGVSVSYSRSADLYSLMDNVSGWLDGFVIPEYREEWVRLFGWSPEDQRWADRYRAYRQRTFIDETQQVDSLTSPDGIFASRSENTAGADPLATYFLAQPNVETALKNLGRFASPRDAQMLRGFYRHFESEWRMLLGESTPLAEQANKLQARFDSEDVEAFIQRVSDFYGVAFDGKFEVFFTRHPPGPHTSAEPIAGNYILLHSPTVVEVGDWDTIVMHEVVHFISSRQPDEQKQELSRRFLSRCPIPKGASRLWMIEEPLAVAWGQAAYSAGVLDEPLDPNDNWYSIPWVNVVARTIAPSIISGDKAHSRIDGRLIDQAADRCIDLTAIALKLNESAE